MALPWSAPAGDVWANSRIPTRPSLHANARRLLSNSVTDEWQMPSFDRSAARLEAPFQVGFAPKSSAALMTTLPAATMPDSISAFWQTRPSHGEHDCMSAQSDGLSFNSFAFNTVDTDVFSPSPAPSLGNNRTSADRETTPTRPVTPDSAYSECGYYLEYSKDPSPPVVARKRGRPRLAPVDLNPTARRVPHNQVERKYREGLNIELERLRRAVPTLPQRDESDLLGPPKPTKALVLASAIEYIQFMEAECRRLTEDNGRLCGIDLPQSRSKQTSSTLQRAGWKRTKTKQEDRYGRQRL